MGNSVKNILRLHCHAGQVHDIVCSEILVRLCHGIKDVPECPTVFVKGSLGSVHIDSTILNKIKEVSNLGGLDKASLEKLVNHLDLVGFGVFISLNTLALVVPSLLDRLNCLVHDRGEFRKDVASMLTRQSNVRREAKIFADKHGGTNCNRASKLLIVGVAKSENKLAICIVEVGLADRETREAIHALLGKAVLFLRDFETVVSQLALSNIDQFVVVDREVTRTHGLRLFDFLELIVADFVGGIDEVFHSTCSCSCS